MKSFIIASIVLLSGSLIACKKHSNSITTNKDSSTLSDTITPPCILSKISVLQSLPKQNPPAVVYEYRYNNRKVYYITADCCDQYNLLYDSACNLLCAPDGGITGHGDGTCADFYQTATNQRLIWRDPR